MADLSAKHFPNLCRCCMIRRDKKNPQYPLFLQHGQYGRFAKNSSASLLEIINTCLGITIHPHDGLPANICATCENSLIDMYNFRTQCLQTADKLASIKLKISHNPRGRPSTSTNLLNCDRTDDEDDDDDNAEYSDSEGKHTEDLEFVQVDGDHGGNSGIQTRSSKASTPNQSHALRLNSLVHHKYTRSHCATSDPESDQELAQMQQMAGSSAKKRKHSRVESNATGSPHEAKIFEPVESDDVRSALANIEDIGFLSLQTPERDHGTILRLERLIKEQTKCLNGLKTAYTELSVRVQVMASNAATSRSVGAASEEAVEEVADDAAAVGFDLPIRAEKDLEELESRLRLMPMCKKSLIRKLLRFGGRDGRSTARTLASELIADDIYMRYSWNGTLSKASFCNFKELIDVVLSVVRYQHPDFTMQELIKFYQDHLKQAKFRLNRKMADGFTEQ